MKNVVITILISFLLPLFSFAQNKCGSVFTQDDKKRISEIRMQGSKMSKKSGKVMNFKVQPFIVRIPDTGEASIDPARLSSFETELNNAFLNVGIQFDFCSHQFVDCRNLFNIDSDHKDDLLLDLRVNMINIFFVNSIDGAEGYYIQVSNGPIVMASRATEPTLVHEMGHYFGLAHTFQEDNNGNRVLPILTTDGSARLLEVSADVNPVESLDGANCRDRADGFCDTSADYLYPINFPSSGIDITTCQGTFDYHKELRNISTWEDYNPPIHNFMSYYPDDCLGGFTNEQKGAMLAFASAIHGNLRDNCVSNNVGIIKPDFCEQTYEDGFICNGFCNISPSTDHLSINCGALEAATADGTITVSAPQISNKSNVSISNFKIEYSLIGGESHLLGVKSYTNTIEPGKTITPNGPFFYTNNVPSGYYKLQIKLVSNLSINQSCISNDEFFIGAPTPPPPTQENTCFNGVKDLGEVAVDCGGPCDLHCSQTCYDGLQNGYESGIDCGGVSCEACEVPDSPCFDGEQNHGETGVDCGGLYCIPCTCNDGIWNGNEQGVDCGGGCLKACPTCHDGLQNQGENGVDCGGLYCEPCLPIGCNHADGTIGGTINSKYEVENYIISPAPNGRANVGVNANTVFDAGRYIDLMPGFTAEYRSRFDAFIDGCGGISTPKFNILQQELRLRNYPNPFTGETTIEFELPNEKPVTLFVSDMTGKKIITLLNNEPQIKGVSLITFNGYNYPPGIYYYTLQTGDYVKTQKMILMK